METKAKTAYHYVSEYLKKQNKNQADKLSVLRHQIADKAVRIDAVIASLGKAVK